MAIVYYPKNNLIARRDTISSSFETIVLASSPSVILYFDTASNINSASVEPMLITSSWAANSVSASWAPGGSGVADGGSYNISSSFASSSISSSYLIGSHTGSTFGTASWSKTSSISISASWAPVGDTATYTSSLWGTASWSNNSLTASSVTNPLYLGAESEQGAIYLLDTANTTYHTIIAGDEQIVLTAPDIWFEGRANSVNGFYGDLTGNVTGSVNGTSSWSNNAKTASYLNVTASWTDIALTASFVNGPHTGSTFGTSSWSNDSRTSSLCSGTSSWATTASFAISASWAPTVFSETAKSSSWASQSLSASFLHGQHTGSTFGTSSWAVSSSTAISASNSMTASYVSNTVKQSISASYLTPNTRLYFGNATLFAEDGLTMGGIITFDSNALVGFNPAAKITSIIPGTSSWANNSQISDVARSLNQSFGVYSMYATDEDNVEIGSNGSNNLVIQNSNWNLNDLLVQGVTIDANGVHSYQFIGPVQGTSSWSNNSKTASFTNGPHTGSTFGTASWASDTILPPQISVSGLTASAALRVGPSTDAFAHLYISGSPNNKLMEVDTNTGLECFEIKSDGQTFISNLNGTGSLQGTASWAVSARTSSMCNGTASWAVSAGTSSYFSGSYVNVYGDVVVNGNITGSGLDINGASFSSENSAALVINGKSGVCGIYLHESPTAVPVGFNTEVNGQLADFGVNFAQMGSSKWDFFKPGAFFRIDTRLGYESQMFTVQYVTSEGGEQVVYSVTTTGDMYTMGNVSSAGTGKNYFSGPVEGTVFSGSLYGTASFADNSKTASAVINSSLMQLPYSSSTKTLTQLVQTGSTYVNATQNLLFVYNGTAWKSCSLF